jgi:hypothetical protein
MKKLILLLLLAGLTLVMSCKTNDQLPPSSPILSFPVNSSIDIGTTVTLKWGKISGASSYSVQLSTSNDFGNIFFNKDAVISDSIKVDGLLPCQIIYWRVNSKNQNSSSPWSSVFMFTTKTITAPVPILPIDKDTLYQKSVLLTWASLPNATTYNVQVSSVALIGIPSTTGA